MHKGNMLLKVMVCALVLGFALAAGAERSGKDVYDSTCSACHATGALGAPKVGTGEWADLAESRGIDALTSSALEGVGSMPAKGGCGECSDSEIRSAVEYMTEQSR